MIATSLYLGLCLLAGGASRISDAPVVFIRPLAVLLIGGTLALSPTSAWRGYRQPLLLLGAFAATMAVQLIPLPPALWSKLPLSLMYADALSSAGLDSRWRPLSIAPDLTVNSLLALLPPLAVLLAVSRWSSHHRGRLLTSVLVGMAFSAVLGLAQFVGGANSPLYLWIDRSEGVADGVFANRNHQAAFLACGLALLGRWIVTPAHRGEDGRSRSRPSGMTLRKTGVGWRLATGTVLAALFLVTVVATGSRTGTMLAIVAAGYSYWCVIRSPVIASAGLPPIQRFALRWGWVLVPLLLAAMTLSDRAVTFERLTATDATTDQRARALPVLMDMLARVLPFGSGYGTFDPLFRTFEPAKLLHPGVFNHAHNDFLELVLIGGLPALMVMLLTTVWFARTAVRLLRAQPSGSVLLGRSAAVAALLIATASIVDYPARTPLIACFLVVLVTWMSDGARAKDMPESG